jgi:hypothetical protein
MVLNRAKWLKVIRRILLGILAFIFWGTVPYFLQVLIPQAKDFKGTLVPSTLADLGKLVKKKDPNANRDLSDEELGSRMFRFKKVRQIGVPGFGIIYLTQALPDDVWQPIAKDLIMSHPEYETLTESASENASIPERYYKLVIVEKLNIWKFVLNWNFLWMGLALMAGLALFPNSNVRLYAGILAVLGIMALTLAAGIFALWLVAKIALLVWRSFV